MAERFHGLVPSSTNAWAFRARLMFDESADNIPSLDVKKRHCQLPKIARTNLKAMLSAHTTSSTNAWKRAGTAAKEVVKETKDSVANRSITEAPVSDLSYAPGAQFESESAVASRKERIEDVGEKTAKAIQDPTETTETLKEKATKGSVVVPIQGLKANSMWLPLPHTELGQAQTLVNKAHSWVAEAYGAAEYEPGIAIVLHQLFTILARAELEVRSVAWKEVRSEDIEKIFERFRSRASMIGEDLADSLNRTLEKENLKSTEPEE